MRLVMEISGARAVAAADTRCGLRIRAARIVDGRQAREPVRRNGHRAQGALGWDSVERMRKFDSHCYVWARKGPKELPDGHWACVFREARRDRVRGGGRARENRQGLAERTFCR